MDLISNFIGFMNLVLSGWYCKRILKILLTVCLVMVLKLCIFVIRCLQFLFILFDLCIYLLVYVFVYLLIHLCVYVFILVLLAWMRELLLCNDIMYEIYKDICDFFFHICSYDSFYLWCLGVLIIIILFHSQYYHHHKS